MRAGGGGGVGRCVQKWGTLMLWDADLWKLSVQTEVFLARFLDLPAVGRVGRVHRDVGEVVDGDAVDWETGDG